MTLLAQADEPARGTKRERAAGNDNRAALDHRWLDGLRWMAIIAAVAMAANPLRLGRAIGVGARPRGLFSRGRAPRLGTLVGIALGSAAMGALAERRAKKRSVARPLIVERSITIGKSADELYRLLRKPDTLSRVMGSVAKITSDGDGRTHWSVKGPLERTLECDTRLVEDRPAERLRWESVPGSGMHNAISVGFRPAPEDWGTEVSLQFRLDVDGGALGVLTKHLGPVPGALASKALHRYKSLAETGEVPTLDRQPAARKNGRDIEGGRA